MPVEDLLNGTGLALGFIGALILAFSLNGFLREIELAIDATDTTLEYMLDPNAQPGIPKFRGLIERIRREKKRSGRWTTIGLLFVAVAFFLQLLALIVTARASTR
jgi:hypothetical protein